MQRGTLRHPLCHEKRNTMLKLLGIGDNVCDKYRNRGMMYPGGQALNVAVYAHMLGAQSAYMGVFGTDAPAALVMRTLDELGVDRSRCRQYEGENGYAVVDFKDGDRYFVTSNKGGIVNQYPLALTGEDMAYIRGFDHIHSSENGHVDHLLPQLKETGVPFSYDFSVRWNKPGHLDQVAKYIDVAFLYCDADDAGVQEICGLLLSKGCKSVMATRGKRGAVFCDGIHTWYKKPHLVEAVDTLGAGDSFAAAFLLTCTRAAKEDPAAFGDKTSSYYTGAVAQALEDAAVFSAKTCLTDGAFGHGAPYTD